MRRSFLLAAIPLVLAALPLGGTPTELVERHAPLLADLFRLGGYGKLPTERAAFLVAAEGGCECRVWPFSVTTQRQSFHGAVPPGTIAIAHTHPNHIASPSIGDHALADALGIPVIVVTAREVSAALPGAREKQVLLKGAGWSRTLEGSGRCRLLLEAPAAD